MELNPAKSQFQNFFEHRRSFRGLQHSVSTISPDILKSMIGANPACTESQSQTQTQTRTRSSSPENASVSLPLTIFYNGTVSVFDLPRDKAEMIMRLAQEGNMKNNLVDHTVKMSSDEHDKLMEKLTGDLPIARKKSLQRFLEKRKERNIFSNKYSPSKLHVKVVIVGGMKRMITSSPYAACGSQSLVE